MSTTETPLEPTTYVWAEPGASDQVEGFAYYEVLTVALEGESDAMVPATLVKSGRLTDVDADITITIPIGNARARTVSQAEAMDGPRTMVGSHVCTKRTAPQCQSRQWTYGTISDCTWDEILGTAHFHLSVDLEEPPTITTCLSNQWMLVDLFCFALRPFNKNSVLLHNDLQVRERHDQLAECLRNSGKSTHWDSGFTTKQIKKILGETYAVDNWAKIPIFNFETCNLFWRSVNRCMDFAFYVLGNRSGPRARAVPRSLMDQTPDDLRASTKRKARTPQRPAPTRSVRVALDMSEMAGAAPLDDAADSDSDIEAVAMANPTIPPVPGLPLAENPSAAPPAVPVDTYAGDPRHRQSAAAIFPNQDAHLPPPAYSAHQQPVFPEISPSHRPSITMTPNQEALFDLLRASKADKDKAACRMTEAQHNVFHIISNGKSVLGTPYQNPSVFFAALRSYSRDMGVLFYPTKCKGVFAFEFGETVFIEEFQYCDWKTIAAQSKLVDMNDFSKKAKRPDLPLLASVSALVACVDNFLHLAERIFKLAVVDEVRRIATFLRRNQPNISYHGTAIVEPLTLWTNQLLFKLRVALESGSADQLHDFRVAIHVNAAEFSSVIQGALIETVRRLESRQSPNDPSRGKQGKAGSKRKPDGPDFQVVRDGIPAHNGKRVCYHNLSAKGCPGGADKCKRANFCHFVPKKSDLTEATLAALKHHFGPLRSDLQ